MGRFLPGTGTGTVARSVEGVRSRASPSTMLRMVPSPSRGGDQAFFSTSCAATVIASIAVPMTAGASGAQ